MRTELPQGGLNIVPFIDIMLALLCIVLSVSTFIVQGTLDVRLPESESGGGSAAAQKPLILEADAQGALALDGERLSLDGLKDRLLKLEKDQTVELHLDGQSRFQIFVDIAGALKAAEHENFTIATAERHDRH
ncbi:MAG: biopolymer transporter ExbD [Succinivibrio sp.]|nr:biopolymer transporter ExbD [Succinivibrio sp.]